MVILRSLDDQIKIQVEEGQNLLLGRMAQCDIVVDEPSVSSQHARIQLMDNQLRIVDMGSTNGTRINYAAIDTPKYVLDGDTIEFGNLTLTIDGPNLESPKADSVDMPAITGLEPLDVSQEMSDTMLSIPLPSQEEMDDAMAFQKEHSHSHQDASEESGGETQTEAVRPTGIKVLDTMPPDRIAFFLSLGIMGVAAFLLWLRVWILPESL